MNSSNMDTRSVFRPLPSKYIVFTADYILPFFITLAVVVSAYLVLYSDIFKITKIECQLDFVPCQSGSITAEIDKLQDENIFRVQPNEIISRLTSGDFTIKEAEIKKVLPNRVIFILTSVYPVVALKIESEDIWIILDEKNRVIGTKNSDPNVPSVILTTPLTVTIGKALEDQQLLSSIKTAIKIAEELIKVKSIKLVDDNTLILTIDDHLIAYLSPKKDELVQLRTLQTILADDTISKEVKTIDVRFSQPVLR